jgi:RHS repeat-associated protein
MKTRLFTFLVVVGLLSCATSAFSQGTATAALKEAYIPLPGGGKAIYDGTGKLRYYQHTDGMGTITAISPNIATNTATMVEISETSGSTVTVTTSNSFLAGQRAVISGLVGATWLNGQIPLLSTATSTSFTFQDVLLHGSYGPSADTGTATVYYSTTTATTAPYGEDYDNTCSGSCLTSTTDYGYAGMGQEVGTSGGVAAGYGAQYVTPHRRYSAIQGRWLSPDPLYTSENAYSYASGLPMIRTDPTGLQDGGDDGGDGDDCDDDCFDLSWDGGWGGGWDGGLSWYGWGWGFSGVQNQVSSSPGLLTTLGGWWSSTTVSVDHFFNGPGSNSNWAWTLRATAKPQVSYSKCGAATNQAQFDNCIAQEELDTVIWGTMLLHPIVSEGGLGFEAGSLDSNLRTNVVHPPAPEVPLTPAEVKVPVTPKVVSVDFGKTPRALGLGMMGQGDPYRTLEFIQQMDAESVNANSSFFGGPRIPGPVDDWRIESSNAVLRQLRAGGQVHFNLNGFKPGLYPNGITQAEYNTLRLATPQYGNQISFWDYQDGVWTPQPNPFK